MKALDNLQRGAETFRERNALYGDNYLRFGEVMQRLFPDGVVLNSPEAFNRYGALTQCVAKLSRYCAQFDEDGHEDSAHDLMVYAAILQELTGKPSPERFRYPAPSAEDWRKKLDEAEAGKKRTQPPSGLTMSALSDEEFLSRFEPEVDDSPFASSCKRLGAALDQMRRQEALLNVYRTRLERWEEGEE